MFFATACSPQGSVESVLRFFACPKFLKMLHLDPDKVDQILLSDFNCGYIAAISTVAAILILFLLLKLICFIFFRTKRCSKVIVPLDGGSIVVSRSAIEATVRNEIRSYTQISVRKLLLFNTGKRYSLKLLCEFDSKGSGMPEIAQELRPKLREVMERLFGITNLTDISISVERLRDAEDEDNGYGSDVPHAPAGI